MASLIQKSRVGGYHMIQSDTNGSPKNIAPLMKQQMWSRRINTHKRFLDSTLRIYYELKKTLQFKAGFQAFEGDIYDSSVGKAQLHWQCIVYFQIA